jgi:hypothetical protein
MSDTNGRTHEYHAEATILEGHLRLPLIQEIKPQAHAKLTQHGGYLSERMEDYRLESVISIRSGYTHVAGNRGLKPGHGWATLTTTVLEGLNILDVLTADRVVGQIITEHPLVGYVPSISFLGTRFENLRIAGHPVNLDLDLSILGARAENDAPYTTDPALIGRVGRQYDSVGDQKEVPADLSERYNRLSSTLGSPEALECSLVNGASGGYPGSSFGHVIHIPDFGQITLAKLTVLHEDFKHGTGVPRKTTVKLTMIDLKLGCVIEGLGGVGNGSSNGTTHP